MTHFLLQVLGMYWRKPHTPPLCPQIIREQALLQVNDIHTETVPRTKTIATACTAPCLPN